MDNNQPDKQSGWQVFIAIGTLGMQMGTCIIGSFLVGLYLDRWLDTAPWLMLILTLLGVGAAFKVLFEYAKK